MKNEESRGVKNGEGNDVNDSDLSEEDGPKVHNNIHRTVSEIRKIIEARNFG